MQGERIVIAKRFYVNAFNIKALLVMAIWRRWGLCIGAAYKVG